MEKYIVLSRAYNSVENEFSSESFVAQDESEAWEYVEESVATQMSQDWLLTFDEAKDLYKELGEALKEESEITPSDLADYEWWKENPL